MVNDQMVNEIPPLSRRVGDFLFPLSSFPPDWIRHLLLLLPDVIPHLRRPLCRMSSGLGRFTCGAPSLFSSLRFFYLPAVLPFPKYAYFGIKWPIFLKKSPFLLHIPIIFRTFAPDLKITVREDMRNTPPIWCECTASQSNTNNRNAIGDAR